MEPEVLSIDPWGEALRTALHIRALVALAAALLFGGTLLGAPAASATPPSAESTIVVSARAVNCIPNCWVSVSFNTHTLRSGWTQKGRYGSKKGAMNSAHDHCRARPVNAGHAAACKWPGMKDAVTKNGCVAVAWLTRDGQLVKWTVGRAYGPMKSMRAAKRKLDGQGTRDAGYACAPRRF